MEKNWAHTCTTCVVRVHQGLSNCVVDGAREHVIHESDVLCHPPNCKTEFFMRKLHEGPRRLETLGGITFFLLIYGGNGVHGGIVVVVAVARNSIRHGREQGT